MTTPAVLAGAELDPVPPGIGIVAPSDLALDRELWRWVPEPVSLYITRTPYVAPDLTGVDKIEQFADLDAIAAGCREVADAQPAVTAYLCTSGSFIHGLAGEQRIRAAMEAAGAERALTTSGALLDALKALGVRRVAIGAPYAQRLTQLLEPFLAQAGVETTGSACLGMDADIARVNATTVFTLARSIPRDGAEAVFLSCTNLPTHDVIGQLEAELGIPVLSANLVTMWAALRELRVPAPPRQERLFRVR